MSGAGGYILSGIRLHAPDWNKVALLRAIGAASVEMSADAAEEPDAKKPRLMA